MTYKIEVTEEDIRRGKPQSCCSCPVFRAIARTTGKAVEVLCKSIALGKEVEAALPEKARKFIEAFDDGRPVKPFTFTLRLP